MRLTTRGRYAVTAMLDLAMHGGEGPVCLNEIARRRDISPAYLERLFRNLRRRGLVCSTRGAHGGYQLCRCAGEISVAEVIAAVDESLDATACDGDCGGLTHDLWEELTQHVRRFLETKTLAELCEARQREDAARELREEA
ncbi:Iron-sulfur cluster assembly transcription factor IscR [Salinisphaera sp. PC39]|uniref:Rrf2 family transcriptional regulator n=1 Tax=Salinisphaera sp. PC39 TaxID=1304156 RepID=UPI0033427203